MKKTRKTLAILLAFVLTVSLSVAGTIAYLTDTDSAKNVFTTGNVQIDLTEAVVEEDEFGNLVAKEDGSRNDVLTDELDEYDYGTIYPGQTIYKDPTITNLGSEDAYIAAVVTVTDGKGDIERLIGSGYENLLDITKVLSGGYVVEGARFKQDHPLFGTLPVYGDDTYSVYQTADKEKGEYKFYFFIEPIVKGVKEDTDSSNSAPVEPESHTLFTTITIPATWGNEEMAEFVELSIVVDAYGVQAHGFADCYTAMTTAFPTAFPFA